MALAVATTALALYLASALGWTRDSVYLVDFSCFNPPERCVAPAHGPAAGCRARWRSFLRFCSVLLFALWWGECARTCVAWCWRALCMSVVVLVRSRYVCHKNYVCRQPPLVRNACHGLLWSCAGCYARMVASKLPCSMCLGFADLMRHVTPYVPFAPG